MPRFAGNHRWIAVLLLLWNSGQALAESSADANPFCASVPRQGWISAEEVSMRLMEIGFRLVRLRMADDKCYAIVARDVDGKIHDLVMHPVTSEIMR
jgi:hypothetical protein